MEEQVIQIADGQVPARAPKDNPGWFGLGDRRINREGRPRSSKAAFQQGGSPANLVPHADRLRLLFIPARRLAFCLSRVNRPWVANLPRDFEIIGCRLDSSRAGWRLTIRSQAFPRIAKGAPIPAFAPDWNGKRWAT